MNQEQQEYNLYYIMEKNERYVTQEGVSIARGNRYKKEGETEIKKGVPVPTEIESLKEENKQLKEALKEAYKELDKYFGQRLIDIIFPD